MAWPSLSSQNMSQVQHFQAKEKNKLLISNDDFDGSTISPILYSTLFYEFSNPDKGPSERFWFFNYIL